MSDNFTRANSAEVALVAFLAVTDGVKPKDLNMDDLKAAIVDLIANLHHFAYSLGFGESTIEGLTATAFMHYTHELEVTT